MAGLSSIKTLASKVIRAVEAKESSLEKLAKEACGEISPSKIEGAIKTLGESSKSIFEGAQKISESGSLQKALSSVVESSADDVARLSESAAKSGLIKTGIKEASSLPKHLYHMTSEQNYKKMLKAGEMYGSKIEQEAYESAQKAGHAINAMPGKYMVSKNNFTRNWMGNRNPEAFGDIDIGETLLHHTSQGKRKMVAIQIPTSSLDLSKLRFRPYAEVCQDLKKVHKVNGSSKLTCEGLPLSELSKYIDKGPVEFVYQGKIPSSLFAEITGSKTTLPTQEIVKNLFG